MLEKESDTGIIAFVYLKGKNDERNKCALSSSELVLTYKGKTRTLRLSDIRTIMFSEKLLLLPIVTGGVFGPFFFIALFGNYFPPVLSLSGFLISIFLLYMGFAGRHALKIETINDTLEIFLPGISDNLKSFVEFSNRFLRQSKDDEKSYLFYVSMSQDQMAGLTRTGKWQLDEQGLFAIDHNEYERVSSRQKKSFLEEYFPVDIRKQNVWVRYEKDENGLLRPKIFGEIRYDDQQKSSNS